MGVPLGQSSASRSAFAAVDVTGFRVLDSDYVNDDSRRLVIVSVVCLASLTGRAMAGYRSLLGGVVIELPSVVGIDAGVALALRFVMLFPVDPTGTYRVTTDVGPDGAGVTLQQWLEVDL